MIDPRSTYPHKYWIVHCPNCPLTCPQPNQKHCSKCSYELVEGIAVSGCNYCGCHTPPQTPSKPPDPLQPMWDEMGIKTVDVTPSRDIPAEQWEPPEDFIMAVPSMEDWEEEFEKEFGWFDEQSVQPNSESWKNIKSFIRTILARQKEEAYEEGKTKKIFRR